MVAGVVWWGGGWSGDDAGLILVMTMMHDDDDDVLCHRGKDERLKLLQLVCFGCFSRSALVVRLHKLRRSFPASFLSCCSRWFWGQMLSKIDTLKPPERSQAYVCGGGAGECVYVVCWSMWCLCVDICGVGLCGVVLRHLGVWVCVTSLRGARMTPEKWMTLERLMTLEK